MSLAEPKLDLGLFRHPERVADFNSNISDDTF
jgi:hypothetical protein